jgi:DNA-binding transcriptional ArsR family regulator
MTADETPGFPFDPERDVLLDARTIRGLAHPLRVKMLGLLRVKGPATATQLAEQLGESTGSTSYHLRQLAAYGFVVEDTSRGEGRERWWRSAHRATHYDPVSADPEVAAAGEVFMRALIESYSDRMRTWVGNAPRVDIVWQKVGDMSDVVLELTPHEAHRLSVEMAELLERYRHRETPPEGAEQVAVQYQVLPLLAEGSAP